MSLQELHNLSNYLNDYRRDFPNDRIPSKYCSHKCNHGFGRQSLCAALVGKSSHRVLLNRNELLPS